MTNDTEEKTKGSEKQTDTNPDPITGETGSHPVGVAAGSTGGALTGAAIGGAVGGPVGATVGAAIGAIAGGLAGKGFAEVVNPTAEEMYWKGGFKARPYYKSGTEYETYQPYYQYGYEAASRVEFRGRKYEEIEQQLEMEWPNHRGTAQGEFSEFKGATRDAFERASHSIEVAEQEAARKDYSS